MRYVALIHKDPDSSYGVTLPDVPGCFSAGDTLDEALRNAAEAILFHTEGEDLPLAREPEAIIRDPALADVLADALIASVEVGPADREQVPLDPILVDAVDEAAGREGISRASFVERALRAALAEH